MRIVIDLQAAQTPQSRHRGIGRYSLALAKAMLRRRGPHEVLIALNGMFEDTIAPLREAFEGLAPPDAIRVWHAAVPPMPLHAADDTRRAAEAVRGAFLASLEPDFVHVASLFESDGLAVPGESDPRFKTAITLYDLIPLINAEIYLNTDGARAHYGAQVARLQRADLWLAISESSRQEGIEHLGMSPDRVVAISSAADEHFTPAAVPAARESELRERLGFDRPFVMYTGGIDHRKNIDGLIRAWAALPADLRSTHQLAIVCSVRPEERAVLEKLAADCGLGAHDMVMTGFVSEDDLVDLYRLCKLFVFPSKHEGFGLPALEAMRCGAPVIGADNSSIPEVIGLAEAMFDARSVPAMTAAIERPLRDDAFRARLAAHGLERAQRFTWDACAEVALAAMERHQADVPRLAPPATARAGKPTLAYVSPLPPLRSGVADYSAELLPALAAHYDIDLVLAQGELEPLPPGTFRERRDLAWFEAHGHAYDRVLYHLGNSEYHAHMPHLLALHPGTVMLHDFYLSGMQHWRDASAQRDDIFARAIYESHGWQGAAKIGPAPDIGALIGEFPASFEVLRGARGVIVHSEFSRVLARRWFREDTARDWAVVPHLRVPLPIERAPARESLRLREGDFLVCSFGILGRTKLNDRLLAAWRRTPMASDARCHLVFVGENEGGSYGREMAAAVAEAGPNVRITGWASQDDYRRYLNAADVAVQLRGLTRGETSGTVLDAMNHAVPVIANANGSMAYLPRDAVMLLDDEFTDEALSDALERLWRDTALRRERGEAGRRIIETLHSPQDCARGYAEAIERFAAVPDRAREAIAGVAAALPPVPDEAVAVNVARAIAQDLPPPSPARQLVVDVTPWCDGGEPPAMLKALIETSPRGWRVEPVRQDGAFWRYARAFTSGLVGLRRAVAPDDLLEMQPGDFWARFGEPPDEPGAPPKAAPASPPEEKIVPRRVTELASRTWELPREGEAALVWRILTDDIFGAGAHCFVDVSELVLRDWRSGIQRVVKNYLMDLLRRPPEGFTVLPVYADRDTPGFRVATRFLGQLAGLGGDGGEDPPMQARAGDVFFGLDLQPHIAVAQAPTVRALREAGVRVVYMVYDLLPIELPDCFLADGARDHAQWLETVASVSDRLVCISESVAHSVERYLRERRPDLPVPDLRAVHLGADLAATLATRGVSQGDLNLLRNLRGQPAFLMVGTLEPRKSHREVLAAFEHLWANGEEVRLVIVGRPGWQVESLVRRLERHPERNVLLFWWADASDELVERVYEAVDCLLLASRGEGFGLPLVEAAQRGLPIMARDIEVFREIADGHAFYFDDDSRDALAERLMAWVRLFRHGRHPVSRGMPWLTWRESAGKLRDALFAPVQSV